MRTGPRLGAVSLLAGCAAVLAAYLTWPLAPDHGIIGLVGRTWLRGGLPYRDAFDTKGPLAYAWFALVEGAFGPSALAVRAVDAAMLAVAASLFGAALRPLVGRAVAWGSAALLVCFVPALGYENTAQPDGWVGLATAPAVIACWAAPTQAWSAALLGLVAGASGLVKPLYLVFAAAPPIIAALARVRWQTALAQGCVALAAAAMILVGAWGWFAAHGGTRSLIDVYLHYTAQVYWAANDTGAFGHVFGVWAFWQWGYGRFVIPVAVAGAIVLWRRDARFASVVIGWSGCIAALVAVQGRFFPYQWLPILPPLCLLTTVGASECVQRLRELFREPERRWALPAWGALAAVVVAALASIVERNAQDVVAAAAVAVGARDRSWYERRFTRQPYYADESREHREAAAWLKAQVAPGKSVGVWSFNPVAVWLSGRTVATRAFGWPLVLGPRTSERATLRREFMASLEAHPPAAFLVDTTWEEKWVEDASLAAFPELQEFLERRYVKAGSTGALMLLARRDVVSSAPPQVSGAGAGARTEVQSDR